MDIYNRYIRAIAGICFLIGFSAQANITIYPMAVGLDSKGEGSVRILSKTNEVQFVKTKLLKIIHPGTPEEKEIVIEPGGENSLAIMPPKFAIPGGSSKLIRFVAMDTPEKEVLYRVMFESVPSLDETASENTTTSIKTDLSVNLVWGILVTVPPRQPKIDISITPDHQFLQNNGTQRVKISDVGLCQRGEKEADCLWKKDNRNLFPDKQYTLPATAGYEKLMIKYKNWIDQKITTTEFNLN